MGTKRTKLLRDVYEENLGIAAPPGRAPQRVGTLGALIRNRVVLWVAFLAFAFGGVGSRERPAAPIVPATLDEEITQRFGAASDPGLQLSADVDVSLASVYGLEVKTIIIDAGHGGRDPGAVGPSGLTEKTVTLDVARRLARRLEAHGFTVRMTREGDTFLTIKNRVRFAIEQGGDILISLHTNALEEEPEAVVETYYFDDLGDSASRRVAARENAHSGFTMSEWRNHLGALAAQVKQEESQRLASSAHEAVYSFARQTTPEVADWGVRGGPFAVLSHRWRGMSTAPGAGAIPAILSEIAVINHAPDEALLQSDAFREGIAGALFEGILSFLAPADSIAASS